MIESQCRGRDDDGQCRCCATQAMLDDPQGSHRLMRDGDGNVMIDSKSKVPLCKCGHPVLWHPPGSASTQTQVTGER